MDRQSNRQRPRIKHTSLSLDGFMTAAQRPTARNRHLYIPKATEEKHHAATAAAAHKANQYPQSYLRPPSEINKEPETHKEDLPSEPAVDIVKTPRAQLGIFHKLIYRRIVAGGVALVLLLVVVSGSWVSYKFLKNTVKVFGGSIASNIGGLFSNTVVNGEKSGRINILLAGDSADDPGHQGGQLTDSIMIVSIDIKNNTGFLLSVPRDLWVNIPSLNQHAKINSANDASKFSAPNLPSGGMGQLQQIVQNDLGIPIDYYALIDYTAFKDAVNAVGGITVNIQSGDPRGLYDAYTNLQLSNGEDTLNGQEALNLARARGDNSAGDISYGFPNSDFDRTMHQRQMLVALKDKASSLGIITNPIKIGQLFDAIGNNVQTDMSLADVLKIDQLSKGVNDNALQSLTYSDSGSNPLLTSYTAPDGEDALIPTAGVDDFSQVQGYYQRLVSSNPVVKEDANVVVLNGSNTDGLAKEAQATLETKGVNVTSIADASKLYPNNIIIDNSDGSDPATLALLKSLYGNYVTTQQLETASSNPNFILIIGESSAPAIQQ